MVIFVTNTPIVKDSETWVEADGKRVGEWKAGTTEMPVPLAAGTHQVAIYCIEREVRRTIFEGELSITAGNTSKMAVGP